MVEKLRLDKWLWAARFYKTRSLATEAVNGGKVHLNQQRAKPSKEVKVGDALTVRIGQVEKTVVIQTLSSQRRPYAEACLLYEETPESVLKREQLAEQRKQNITTYSNSRPNKRDRRLIRQFTRTTPESDR